MAHTPNFSEAAKSFAVKTLLFVGPDSPIPGVIYDMAMHPRYADAATLTDSMLKELNVVFNLGISLKMRESVLKVYQFRKLLTYLADCYSVTTEAGLS